ncbi:type I secretion system permease/ATPase [Paraburkholderia caribensis]|uniref:type I secretion system permease/ATPase n=1 Tax=Paraburkholderia caribensis TaxID=75105 RepID=UPI001D06A7AE|nr:type I secretion system permease/ATPase [Paraburkholderia caribensis]
MLQAIRRHLLIAGAFGIASNVLVLAPTIYLLQVYDRVLPSRSIETLAMLMIFMAIVLAMTLIVDVIRSRIFSDLARQLGDRLDRLALAARIDAHARRTLTTTLATPADIASLRSFFSGTGIIALLDLPWLFIYVGLVFLFHWILGLIATASALLLIGLTVMNDRLTKKRIHTVAVRQRETDQLYAQISRNAEVVAVMGMHEAWLARWAERKRVDVDAQTTLADTSMLNRIIGRIARQAIQVVMMGAGAWLVINDYATGGIMIATTMLLGKALAPVDQLIGSWKQLAEVRQAWGRLDALYQQPRETQMVELPRPNGRISVESLSFNSFATGRTQSRALLSNIAFTLDAGQLLVIVGASASGKSTLLRLLAGVWKPNAGVVRLDGADVSQWPRDSIGRYLGYMPQDVELFAGSVAANIARDPDESRHDSVAIIQAAQRAGVHELVMHLPDGYQTDIGDSGLTLSGGQRQAIALARALYGDPRLVLLDEPNSNLDAEGERKLNLALQRLKAEGITVVVVTHRQGLLALADRVLVLRAGRIDCYGTPGQVQGWMQGRAKQANAQPHAVSQEVSKA